MPQPRIIDTTPNKPEPSGVEQFFSNLSKVYSEKKEKDEIGQLIKSYENNRGNENALEDYELSIQKSNVSPTKRLELLNQAKEMRKDINEDKKLNFEKAKYLAETQKKENIEKAKKEKESTEVKSILQQSPNFTDEEIEDLSTKISPVTARSMVTGSKSTESGKEYLKLREKAISNYVEKSIEQRELAQEQTFAIDTARKAIRGDVQGPGYMAIAKNSPYGQLILGLTPDESALQTANKKLLEGSKGVFGAKPTEKEIFILLNSMLPAIGKSLEANEAGLDFIEKVNNLKIAYGDIVDELTDGGTKFVPDLERQVSQRMKPLQEALRDELKEADKKFNSPKDKKDKKNEKSSNGKIEVKDPKGKRWRMTPEQIESAKEQGVIFEPV